MGRCRNTGPLFVRSESSDVNRTHGAEPADEEQVLVAAAKSHSITGPARDAYMKAADDLGDHEQSRALAALARRERSR